jgi:nitrogen regulatory protein PII
MKEITKRIEMVVDNAFLDTVEDTLNYIGVDGFTVIDVYEGKGEKGGFQHPLGSNNSDKKRYLFVYCSNEEQQKIIAALSDLFEEKGGIMTCSDIACYFPRKKNVDIFK